MHKPIPQPKLPQLSLPSELALMRQRLADGRGALLALWSVLGLLAFLAVQAVWVLPLVLMGLPALATAQAAGQASAEPSPMRLPAAADIEAARKALPTKQEIDAATRALRGSAIQVPKSAVDTSKQAGPDLAELAEQYERMRRGTQGGSGDEAAANRQAAGLMVFVSLGMPRASLENLIADAERTRAMLVLRGMLGGSLKATAQQVQELLGKHEVPWQIDPSLFQRFDIQVVPTYVLIDPSRPVLVACGASQCQQAAFSKVAGDVTMQHALTAVYREDAEFSRLAERYAAPLGGVQ